MPYLKKGDWAALRAQWNDRCAYCTNPLGDDAQVDHVVPRSRGGTDDRDNLVPACCSCNIQKRDLLLLEWVFSVYGVLERGLSVRALRPGTRRTKVNLSGRPAPWTPPQEWAYSINSRVWRLHDAEMEARHIERWARFA